MHKILNFQDISGSNIGSANYHDFNKFFNGVLDDIEGLKCSLAFVLLSHEK